MINTMKIICTELYFLPFNLKIELHFCHLLGLSDNSHMARGSDQQHLVIIRLWKNPNPKTEQKAAQISTALSFEQFYYVLFFKK